MADAAPTGSWTREQRTVLAVACVSSFITPFMGSALNLAVPAIGRDLGLSAVALNWVVGAYLVAAAAFLLPAGRLGDVLGRKRVFLWGVGSHAAVALLAGLATSGWVLVALRALQGAAAAFIFATAPAILTAAFPITQRGRVLGLATASVYLGLSAGPVLGGLLTHYLGWRSIFVAVALLSVGLVVAVVAAIPDEWRGEQVGLDLGGAVLYVLALSAVIGGVSALREGAWGPWVVVVGAVLLVVFVLRERVVPSPTLKLRLFGDPAFAFSNLAALIHYSATFAVSFLLSLYLQSVRGLDARAAGLVLLVQPILMAALSPAAGRLSDRMEPRLVASVGMALSMGALVAFAFLGATSSAWLIGLGLGLLGVGFGLFSSPNTNAVLSAVPRADLGLGAAALGTARMVGQALSMSLVALFFHGFLGHSSLAAADTGALATAMRTAFWLFAGLCAIGIAASLARSPIDRRDD
ncbi:MAG: MFS transporter [Thermoanaerobaculaceae bacterium]|nr:MFS transporter [Thermoanaerobaculaceae bacterium]MDI9622497.1 MFS transporter [Acidobacteriota bacterium]NLH11502.1 MFS transporter [Holophagae bacterium]HPW55915.1 MFS transporter [Thermoanaerobaculaceae bacterium]